MEIPSDSTDETHCFDKENGNETDTYNNWNLLFTSCTNLRVYSLWCAKHDCFCCTKIVRSKFECLVQLFVNLCLWCLKRELGVVCKGFWLRTSYMCVDSFPAGSFMFFSLHTEVHFNTIWLPCVREWNNLPCLPWYSLALECEAGADLVLIYKRFYFSSSSETQGQIVGVRESLNGRKNMAQRKVKNGEKSPWGQCLTRPVPNGRRRSGFWLVPENFCVFLPNQKAERRRPFGTGLVRHCPQGLFSPFFTFLRAIFFRPFRLSLAPTICPWVSEDDFSCENLAGQILVRLKRFKIKNRKCYASKHGQGDPRLHSTTLNWTSELDCLNCCV